jgi:phosphate:Na+ symporter
VASVQAAIAVVSSPPSVFSSLIGGIGIFLIGMTLLTEGVKAAAGGALRRSLTRLTGGAFRGFLSGAAATALVQSSSATTLATIGFVSAGLLTFSQAIGVIVGASVGTTSTGWLVSLIGVHVSIAAFAVPLVAIGALLRLLGRGRTAAAGFAIAGFGLLFVGIGAMQSGMQDVAGSIDLSRFSADSFSGWVVLLGAGLGMTVVMQSSSAAVATTLTALHAGAIQLPQAALLVIGQNVGTTVTSAIAIVGASTPARRTGAAHILFSVLTAAVALALVPLVVPLALRLQAETHATPAITIAAFHTGFNLLGAALLLPLASRFAALVIRLVPARGPQLTAYLDSSVAAVPAVAVEAARLTVSAVASVLREVIGEVLGSGHGRRAGGSGLDAADQALDETRRFLASVRSPAESAADHARHVAVLHAMDHLERLVALVRAPYSPRALRCTPAVADAVVTLQRGLKPTGDDDSAAADAAESAAENIVASRRLERPRILQQTAAGELDPDAAVECLDALRWVENLAYHWWRAAHHLRARPLPSQGRVGFSAPDPAT